MNKTDFFLEERLPCHNCFGKIGKNPAGYAALALGLPTAARRVWRSMLVAAQTFDPVIGISFVLDVQNCI